jgi:hypothetical protein
MKSSISHVWTNDGKLVDAGVLGVHLDTYDDRYVLWAALFKFPGTRDAGVLRYDMITQNYSVFDLSKLTNGANSIINDIVALPDGTVFITNTLNGQIYKLYYDIASGTSSVPELFINNTNLVPQLGFDGIEYVNGYLLAGIFSAANNGGRLLRINASNAKDVQDVKLNGGVLEYIDGMRFNADKSKLYAIKQPHSLMVLESADNWTTANVLQEIDFSARVGFSKTITAVTLIPDQDQDKVYVLSADGFGSEPYAIIRAI